MNQPRGRKQLALLAASGLLLMSALATYGMHRQAASTASVAAVGANVLLLGLIVYLLLGELRERRMAGAALQQSEREYHRLFNHNPQPMWLYDPRTLAIVAVNEAASQLYGYSRSEFLQMSIKDIRPSEDVAALVENVHSVSFGLQHGELWRHRRRDGSVFDVEVSANDIEFAGQPARFVMAIDVTARLSAERQLRKSEAGLASAQRLARLGSWEMDLPCGELHWSAEVYRIFGDSGAYEAARRHCVDLVHPDDKPMVAEAIQRTLSEGVPLDVVHRFLRPDGELLYLHERAEAALDANGRIARLFGTVQDVTEQRRAEEEVRRLNAELELRVKERTRELEAFTYSVSHDLRAPLRSIDGFGAVLERQYARLLDDNGRHYLARVRAATQQMGQLIDDLLQLARITRAEPRLGPVVLSEIARRIADELRQREPQRAVDFVIADAVTATGDANLLAIALSNLLENAWKFSAKKPVARIEFGVTQTGEERIYYVKDNGAGFDMAYMNKLFGVFQRLHRLDEFAGTGVGLAMVQRIIQHHGGDVWAEAAVDDGATFFFTLGRLPAERADRNTAAARLAHGANAILQTRSSGAV